MPLFEKVFNPTLETLEFQIDGKVYKSLPRDFFEIREDYSSIIDTEYCDRGLFIYRKGDDFKAKERKGLLLYLNSLRHARHNWQAYLDEKKKGGITLEEPLKMKRIIRWIKEIEDLLNAQSPIEQEPSFMSDDDLKTKNLENTVFAMTPEIEEVDYVEEEVKRRRGRPPKTFAEAQL